VRKGGRKENGAWRQKKPYVGGEIKAVHGVDCQKRAQKTRFRTNAHLLKPQQKVVKIYSLRGGWGKGTGWCEKKGGGKPKVDPC